MRQPIQLTSRDWIVLRCLNANCDLDSQSVAKRNQRIGSDILVSIIATQSFANCSVIVSQRRNIRHARVFTLQSFADRREKTYAFEVHDHGVDWFDDAGNRCIRSVTFNHHDDDRTAGGDEHRSGI